MLNVIKRPLITEKNTVLAAMNTYVFEVARTATKDDIKKAVEKSFDVKVAGVRTINSRDRVRRVGQRLSKVKHWKKALVRLAAGEKIKVFEGV